MQKEILYNLYTNIMDIEKNPWQQPAVKQTNTEIILPRHSISIKEDETPWCWKAGHFYIYLYIFDSI